MKKNLSFFLWILFMFTTAFTKAQIGANIDFGTGTILGWNDDEGQNANSTTMATSALGFSSSTNYAVMTSGSIEAHGLPITMTSPLGGDFVRLGMTSTGGYVNRLSQTFTIPTGTTGLLVSYAEVLEVAYHACSDNPYFYLALKDASGNVIPGTSVYSTNGGTGGCSSYDPSLSTSGNYTYKNWTTLSYNLSAYVGTAVTLEVYASGCTYTQGAHAGYCYFDAQSCNSSSMPGMLVANGVSYPLNSSQSSLSICGSNSVTVTAPSGATSYTWSGTGISGLTTQSVSITQGGVYGLVCDLPSPCSPTTAVTFTISGTTPTVSVAASNPSVCAGAAVTLTASGASSFTWTPNPNNLLSVTTQTATYTPSVTSTYTIVGIDSNGCTDTLSYQVGVLPSPTLAVTGSAGICSGNSTTLSVTGADTYTWTTGSNATSIVVSPTASTGYSVTGQVTGSGCTQSTAYNVTVYTNSISLNIASYSNVCAGSSVTVHASGAASYTWSANAGGVNTASVALTPTGLTSYTVSGNNTCGVVSNTFTLNTMPTPTFTVSGPDSVCISASPATFTASGTFDYIWSSYGNIGTSSGSGPTYAVSLLPAAPYTFTLNCLGIDINNCNTSFTKHVKVLPLPVLSVSVPSVVCSGSPTTLMASGANTYTWSANAGGVNTASTVVTPTTTTIYTVSGMGSDGCSSSSATTIVINTTTLAVTPTAATICPGSSVSMSAAGASSYTWSTGANTASITVSPTVTTTYTVGGTSTCGTFTNAIQIMAYTAPTVAISGPDSLCVANAATFTATSNGSSYSWSTNGGFISSTSSNGPSYSINLNTPAPYTFTVSCVVTGGNGCTSTAIKQVKALTYVVVSVSGPTAVCQYSSGTLLAGGANSYTWSTGATTPSINVTPTISTTYTVVGASSGCTSGSDTATLAVDNTCQDVWPGDVNSDGLVDNTDILELGLHYTQTGPIRASVSNAWQPFYAADWTGIITNGQNLSHSDCNGDGIIDGNDTVAVYFNYSLTHAFKQAQTTSNAQLTIVPDQASLSPGDWGSASIFLGDAANPASNVNGVAFTVVFDPNIIAPGEMYIDYPVSFVNAVNDNLHFRKPDFYQGMLYTATTHTLSNNVSGNGKIAVLHYKIDPSLTLSQDGIFTFGLSQGNQSSANGAITPLTTGSATLAITGTPTTGVNELVASSQTSVFPNPATAAVNIGSSVMLQKVELLSLTGQMVMSQPVAGHSCQLKLSGVEEGIYFVNVYSAGYIVKHEKIVVQR